MSEALFEKFTLRDLEFRNRIVMSPMCQYSATEGIIGDWHRTHYAERALGGAGLVIVEASAVLPEGRITPGDIGIWNDAQAEALKEIVDLIHAAGAKAGIQLAHAGRKASSAVPWKGGTALSKEDGAWPVVAPSAIAFDGASPIPHALSEDEIARVVDAFAAAGTRALAAGFDVLEIHGAHGYLIHEFYSPLSNHRSDSYGGDLAGRSRLLREVAEALRALGNMPLFARISASDWLEGGIGIEDSVEIARILKAAGVDLVDTSSGGNAPGLKIPLGPSYQVPFSERIRKEVGVKVGAVGLITEVDQAKGIIDDGEADMVFLGRQLLRDPFWPLRNAPKTLRTVPVQYLRAFA